MMKKTLFTTAMLVLSISAGTAGTITNGVWSPGSCGTELKAPAVVTTNVEAYNQSVKDINDWQQKASTYNNCVIQEANADNALIAKTANDEQARFQAEIERIKVETTAASTKLSAKPTGK